MSCRKSLKDWPMLRVMDGNGVESLIPDFVRMTELHKYKPRPSGRKITAQEVPTLLGDGRRVWQGLRKAVEKASEAIRKFGLAVEEALKPKTVEHLGFKWTTTSIMPTDKVAVLTDKQLRDVQRKMTGFMDDHFIDAMNRAGNNSPGDVHHGLLRGLDLPPNAEMRVDRDHARARMVYTLKWREIKRAKIEDFNSPNLGKLASMTISNFTCSVAIDMTHRPNLEIVRSMLDTAVERTRNGENRGKFSASESVAEAVDQNTIKAQAKRRNKALLREAELEQQLVDARAEIDDSAAKIKRMTEEP